MQNPLEITFKGVEASKKLNEVIQEKFEKLKKVSPDITKCHVILEQLSNHHKTANTACVRLDLKVPHFDDIVVSEKCSEDEVSLIHTIIKVFKREKGLIREKMKHRQDKHRVSKEGIFENEENEEENEEKN